MPSALSPNPILVPGHIVNIHKIFSEQMDKCILYPIQVLNASGDIRKYGMIYTFWVGCPTRVVTATINITIRRKKKETLWETDLKRDAGPDQSGLEHQAMVFSLGVMG